MLALTLGEIFQVVFPARFVQLNSEEAGYPGDVSVLSMSVGRRCV